MDFVTEEAWRHTQAQQGITRHQWCQGLLEALPTSTALGLKDLVTELALSWTSLSPQLKMSLSAWSSMLTCSALALAR